MPELEGGTTHLQVPQLLGAGGNYSISQLEGGTHVQVPHPPFQELEGGTPHLRYHSISPLPSLQGARGGNYTSPCLELEGELHTYWYHSISPPPRGGLHTATVALEVIAG